MNEVNLTPYSLYIYYATDLVSYQDKFIKEFGFHPEVGNRVDPSLTFSQLKLCYAFWNSKEVIIAQTLMEMFFDVCNEIDSRKLD